MAHPEKKSTSLAPAYLLVGRDETTIAYTQQWLLSLLCPQNGCGACTTCDQIVRRQHHAITWLLPEKWYTRDELSAIFSRIAFTLDAHESHFFVLQKADFLLPNAANSLLKSLEDPPVGYHFIFLAQRLESVLPTIQSRCLINHHKSDVTIAKTSPLATLFIDIPATKPLAFIKALEKGNPTEQEVTELFEHLLSLWQDRYKKLVANHEAHAAKQMHYCIEEMYHALAKPLTPGSSKLACKNLYLRLAQVAKTKNR